MVKDKQRRKTKGHNSRISRGATSSDLLSFTEEIINIYEAYGAAQTLLSHDVTSTYKRRPAQRNAAPPVTRRNMRTSLSNSHGGRWHHPRWVFILLPRLAKRATRHLTERVSQNLPAAMRNVADRYFSVAMTLGKPVVSGLVTDKASSNIS